MQVIRKYILNHSIYFFILALVSLALVIFSASVAFYLFCMICMFINALVLGKINYKLTIYSLILLVPVTIAIFITSVTFIHDANSYHIALTVAMRGICLVLITVFSIVNINFEQLFLFFLQRRLLSVKIGYPLLTLTNALANLSSEYNKISNASMIRYTKRQQPLKLLYSLLISATRHSFELALSLENRGLNNNKTYWRKISPPSCLGYFLLVINISILVLVFMYF